MQYQTCPKLLADAQRVADGIDQARIAPKRPPTIVAPSQLASDLQSLIATGQISNDDLAAQLMLFVQRLQAAPAPPVMQALPQSNGAQQNSASSGSVQGNVNQNVPMAPTLSAINGALNECGERISDQVAANNGSAADCQITSLLMAQHSGAVNPHATT